MVIDELFTVIRALRKLRRDRFEQSITPAMWYQRGVMDWYRRGECFGVFLRLNNGKRKLVRKFASAPEAQSYLRHKIQPYLDYIYKGDPLYAASPDYKPRDYKVYPKDRKS